MEKQIYKADQQGRKERKEKGDLTQLEINGKFGERLHCQKEKPENIDSAPAIGGGRESAPPLLSIRKKPWSKGHYGRGERGDFRAER